MFYLGCYKRIALRKRFLFTTKWGSITAKINWSGRRESKHRRQSLNNHLFLKDIMNPFGYSYGYTLSDLWSRSDTCNIPTNGIEPRPEHLEGSQSFDLKGGASLASGQTQGGLRGQRERMNY